MVSKVEKVMKKLFGDKVWTKRCGKGGLFSQKLRLEFGFGLAFPGMKMSTFDGQDGGKVGKMMKRVFFDKVWAQSMKKVDFLKS